TTTITTDQGVITIGDGQTTGTLTLGSNGEDVYLDASNLTATITAVAGGNFENLTGVGGSATASINDTITPATVTLTGSTVSEGPTAAYTFTATLSNASQRSEEHTTEHHSPDVVVGRPRRA